MAQNQAPQGTSHPRPEDRHRYDGIFGSSLCGMFGAKKASKSDACALACCGVWLWERNQYLLERKSPKPLKERPLIVAMTLVGSAGAVVWAVDPENVMVQVAVLFVIFGFLWKMFEFQHTRAFFRRNLALDVYRKEHPQDENITLADPGLNSFLRRHRNEIYGAHAICACSRVDVRPSPHQHQNETQDFCSKLWQFLAACCCGTCCLCWCQCCGMCAIAQEHRHLKMVLPPAPELWELDYITMQPWSDYFPKIRDLRVSGEMGLLAHMRALSLLSTRLLQSALVFVIGAAIVTALPVHYSRWELLVLFATLMQPFVFLYFVHWLWHRLDMSVDAVVKYFASGFFVCTGMAIVYEMLVSSFTSIALFITALVGSLILAISGEITVTGEATVEDDNLGESTIHVPKSFVISIAILGAFLNAFVVAGLVEEMTKYLCFWMVEHPDLDGGESISSAAASEGQMLKEMETVPSDEPSELEAPYRRTLPSRGAAITIAMVSTALGFACAENILYVFVYAPPGLDSALSTLIVRCMFPVHPLAAALQSIGVCRRDLEKDSSTQVGRILFPAWLLHGAFDFILMANAVVAQLDEQQGADAEGDDNSTGAGAEDENQTSTADELEPYTWVFGLVLLVPIVAAAFYFVEASRQRRRLKSLDENGYLRSEDAEVTGEHGTPLSRGV